MTPGNDQDPQGTDDQDVTVQRASVDAPADPLIGLLVDDRYRIRARLARGGMATVYIAQDERLDRPAALKVMHPHLAESADFVARFRREARAAARIVHPGVVSVFDQGVVHGQGFLVMELIDGTNLRALLQAQGAFTIDQSLRYVTDILEALHAAHRVGVIHRDIKPENVLVPTEGPVRVTDFGLARAASEVSMSTTGSMMGTVAYMAPETATTGEADARTDIYAVGIMLSEMLTGHVPWDGENAMQMAYHHVHDDVPLPSTVESWIPREIDELVAALVARHPDDRPRDAREALDLVARTRAALPPELAAQRADVQPRPSAGTQTAALELVEPTAPLPGRLVPATSQAIVHTSGTAALTEVAPPPKRRIGTFILLMVTLLVAGTCSGLWWWTEYGPGSYLTMPATANRPLADVQNDLQKLGLASQVTQEFSDTVDEGLVVSTTPGGSEAVHKHAEVLIVVSKGIDMKVVPTVTGQRLTDAQSQLTASGLTLGTVTEEWSQDVEKDKVISQSLNPASSVPHDTPVNLVVSKGREPLKVPDIVGKNAADVEKLLTDLGLQPQVSEAHSMTVAEGLVISQETPSGNTLYRGDHLAYVVSKGPETTQVPAVQGMQEGQARATLEAAGLQVRVERILGGVFGTARSTDPESGTTVRKGSLVTLRVV